MATTMCDGRQSMTASWQMHRAAEHDLSKCRCWAVGALSPWVLLLAGTVQSVVQGRGFVVVHYALAAAVAVEGLEAMIVPELKENLAGPEYLELEQLADAEQLETPAQESSEQLTQELQNQLEPLEQLAEDGTSAGGRKGAV